MSINGITFDERYQKALVHGSFNQGVLSDGILNGCALSNNTTSMTVGVGTMIIGGRLIYIEAAETTNIVSPTGNYVRFYFKIDLTQTPDSETFAQGTIEYDYAASIGAFAALTQEDINEDGNIYECEIAVYSLSGSNIDALVRSIGFAGGGWISAIGETWVYSSVDDPTGVITITGDLTGKYKAGTKIKFMNGGNEIKGIVLKDSTYSSPNTTITFLHEIDPTDSQALTLMANSTITSPCYSFEKAPAGFPMQKSKWRVEYNATPAFDKASPAQNTWYSTGINLNIFMGLVDVEFTIDLLSNTKSSQTSLDGFITLSDTDASESDEDFTCKHALDGPSGTHALGDTFHKTKQLLLDAATTFHVCTKTSRATGVMNLLRVGAYVPLIIRATCAYL